MDTISLCMIVKNEEEVLARCLESARDAVEEIIIVDTGSTDKTKAIAEAYGARVYDFKWINDFSAARNEAFSKATMDFQMWLDADDVIPPESLEQLKALKERIDPQTDIVTMKYVTHFDEHDNPILISTRERLMRRSKNFQWIDPIHECVPLTYNTAHSDILIHHRKNYKEGDGDRNLKIYTALEEEGREFTARQLYYFARELRDHAMWAKAADYFERFLDTGAGWYEDNIAACFNLSTCYGMTERQEKILPILFRSFHYDGPRAEICCEIGYYYKRLQNYALALKWFRVAANLGNPQSLGFVLQDYWGYIPNVESCVCAFELGDFAAAKEYNELAAKFKPDAGAIEINRRVFAAREP